MWGEPTCLRFCETEASVYDVETDLGGARTRPLKQRERGEYRDVPALEAVVEALRTHVERGYPGHGRTWTSPTGRGRLEWGNLRDDYWRPACERVFSKSSKPELVTMTPKMLRKAAITFWLWVGRGLRLDMRACAYEHERMPDRPGREHDSVEQYDDVSELFAALASPVRAAVVHHLTQRGWSVTELADELGVSQPLMSQHLRVLRAARVVTASRTGRTTTYTLIDDHIAHVFLDAFHHSKEHH